MMPGTSAGAQKRWAKEKEETAPAELRKRFSEMGKKSHVGGFGADPEFARRVSKTYHEKQKSSLVNIPEQKSLLKRWLRLLPR